MKHDLPQNPSEIPCKTLHPAEELTGPLIKSVTIANTKVAKILAINVPRGNPTIRTLYRESHHRASVPRGAKTQASVKCCFVVTVAAITMTATQLDRPASRHRTSCTLPENLYPTGVIV